ncbi:MAG: hypothetical protein SGPRY_008648, partial [Prymnesium sp.]
MDRGQTPLSVDAPAERGPCVTVPEGHLFHSAVIREVQIKETHRRPLTKLHGTSFYFVFKLAGQAAADQVAMVQSSRLPHLVWSLFVGERGERERLLRRLYPQVALGSRMIRRGLGKLHWLQMVSRVFLFATEMSLEYQELVKAASTHVNAALKALRSAIRQFYNTPVPSDSSETEPRALMAAKWMALLNRPLESTASKVTDLPQKGSPFTRFMASAFPERPPASQPLQNPHDSQRLGQDRSLPSSSSEPPSHQPMPPSPPGTAGSGTAPCVVMWVSRKGEDRGQARCKYTLFLECSKAKGVELASFLATWFYDFGHQNTSRDGCIMLLICYYQDEDFIYGRGKGRGEKGKGGRGQGKGRKPAEHSRPSQQEALPIPAPAQTEAAVVASGSSGGGKAHVEKAQAGEVPKELRDALILLEKEGQLLTAEDQVEVTWHYLDGGKRSAPLPDTAGGRTKGRGPDAAQPGPPHDSRPQEGARPPLSPPEASAEGVSEAGTPLPGRQQDHTRPPQPRAVIDRRLLSALDHFSPVLLENTPRPLHHRSWRQSQWWWTGHRRGLLAKMLDNERDSDDSLELSKISKFFKSWGYSLTKQSCSCALGGPGSPEFTSWERSLDTPSHRGGVQMPAIPETVRVAEYQPQAGLFESHSMITPIQNQPQPAGGALTSLERLKSGANRLEQRTCDVSFRTLQCPRLMPRRQAWPAVRVVSVLREPGRVLERRNDVHTSTYGPRQLGAIGLDDSFQEFLDIFERVLMRLACASMSLKGFCVTPDGIVMQGSKLDELLMTPMTEMLRKTPDFTKTSWQAVKESFEAIITFLRSDACVSAPDLSDPYAEYVICTDACDVAAGGVLLQWQHPSGKGPGPPPGVPLRGGKGPDPLTQSWRLELGWNLRVIAYYSPSMLRKHQCTPRLQRWGMEIGTFLPYLKLAYRKGADNGLADFLSRYPTFKAYVTSREEPEPAEAH